MPCQDDRDRYPGPADHSKCLSRADKLVHENDMLREAVLGFVEEGKLPSAEVMKIVEKDQIEHRKEDLKRLTKYFTKERDAEKLGKTMLADPRKPLEPQLGFDPDVY